MFAVIAHLRVKPEMDDRFIRAMEDNSRRSVREEPGCARFDVIRDNRDPTHYILYEVYDDGAAFELHRKTSHFARWRDNAAAVLQDKDGQVSIYGQRLYPTDSKL